MPDPIFTQLDNTPIWLTEYIHGPFAIIITGGLDVASEVHETIAPAGGFVTKDVAIAYIKRNFAERKEPYLGLLFRIVPLRSPEDFIRFCSWEG